MINKININLNQYLISEWSNVVAWSVELFEKDLENEMLLLLA